MTARVLRQIPLESRTGLPRTSSTVLLDVPVGNPGTRAMLLLVPSEFLRGAVGVLGVETGEF